MLYTISVMSTLNTLSRRSMDLRLGARCKSRLNEDRQLGRVELWSSRYTYAYAAPFMSVNESNLSQLPKKFPPRSHIPRETRKSSKHVRTRN